MKPFYNEKAQLFLQHYRVNGLAWLREEVKGDRCEYTLRVSYESFNYGMDEGSFYKTCQYLDCYLYTTDDAGKKHWYPKEEAIELVNAVNSWILQEPWEYEGV